MATTPTPASRPLPRRGAGSLHVEHFTAEGTQLDPAREHAFAVELAEAVAGGGSAP